MNIFIQNKYYNWYYSIIENAKSQSRIKLPKTNQNYVYYESHHIIPRCVGGTNDKTNLVLLTAREHFICHFLLIRMVNRNTEEYKKLFYAVFIMSKDKFHHKRKITSSTYQKLCQINGELTTIRNKLKKGTKWSGEAKKRNKGRNQGSKNPFYGKKHTKESLNKIHTPESKIRKSISMKGKSKSQKHRNSLSKSLSGKLVGSKNPFYGKKHLKSTVETIKQKNKMWRQSLTEFEKNEMTRKRLQTNQENKLKDLKKYNKIQCGNICFSSYQDAMDFLHLDIKNLKYFLSNKSSKKKYKDWIILN